MSKSYAYTTNEPPQHEGGQQSQTNRNLDENTHTIEWRRSNEGETVVLLDNKEVIRTVDRAYDEPSMDLPSLIRAESLK